MPALPMPTLDHVVVNVRDQLDAACETYRRLGFTMTPRGHHTLGSMNHLAIFGTEYLELIAAQPGGARQAEILAVPFGLNGLVFGTDDSAAVYAALDAARVPVEPPMQFSRRVALPSGARDATFRTVRLKPGVIPAGRVDVSAHHLTRDLVWRDEWRHHANGTVGVLRAVIGAEDPATVGAVFARMFGDDAVQAIADGCSLSVGLSRFDIVSPAALHAAFGDATPNGDGRDQFMAALTLRTRSLEAAAAALRSGGISAQQEAERILVPATEAFGVALEFRA